MNILNSKCSSCSDPIIVNQKEWADPFAHICVACTEVYTKVDKSELDKEIEEATNEWVKVIEALASDTDEFDDLDLIDNSFEFTEPVCECGAAKAKTPHSTWCPLYD